MTITKTAATSGSDPETDTQSSTLDLDMDRIVLQKRQGKYSVKDVVCSSRPRAWLESSSSDVGQWLRTSAQGGGLYAMEELGLRSFIVVGLPTSIEEGLS